jgi:hypothetical protein
MPKEIILTLAFGLKMIKVAAIQRSFGGKFCTFAIGIETFAHGKASFAIEK